MKTKTYVSLLALLSLFTGTVTAAPPPAAFTYQGQLADGGYPANDVFDLFFMLYDAPDHGNVIAEPLTNTVTVSNGLFTVVLDFGFEVFNGEDRWLELGVRRTKHDPDFEMLSPRQKLTPSPYAVFAFNAATAASVPAANLTGTVPNARLSSSVSLLGGSIESGEITDGAIAAADVNAASFNTTFWQVAGNSGTTAGTHFVGTTDNQPLDLRVNNLRALRLEPNANSPNVLGGYSGNVVGAGFSGATIGGGGSLNNSNAIFANYATIAGGSANDIQAYSDYSSIGGGLNNNIAANTYYVTIAGGTINDIGTNSSYSAIGGGYDNNIGAYAWSATIAGGYWNDIGTESDYSTIGGGYDNNIPANALCATIPGGDRNAATNYAFAAGKRAKANHSGAFVWGDSTNADVTSTNSNSVTMRASGGYRLFSNSGATAGAYLASGGGSWTSMSDRNAKDNFQAVDAREVLTKVVALPLAMWNYRSQNAAIRHMGPMAQDFHAAFGVGESDTGITSVDADGVALAAIQGLNQKLAVELQRRDAENAELRQELAELKQLVRQLIK